MINYVEGEFYAMCFKDCIEMFEKQIKEKYGEKENLDMDFLIHNYLTYGDDYKEINDFFVERGFVNPRIEKDEEDYLLLVFDVYGEEKYTFRYCFDCL